MEKEFDNYLVLVNKDYLYQEKDFKGRRLVLAKDIEGNDVLVEKETFRHYLDFKKELENYGLDVFITSGYRSLEEQEKTIEELKEMYPDPEKLYTKVAPLGSSEHHTGLALDITFSTLDEYQNRLTKYYTEEELKERERKYEIMKKVCSKHGFILRYPKGKETVTQFSYEPWHYRYVGEKAKEIMDNNLTLEEFLIQEKRAVME